MMKRSLSRPLLLAGLIAGTAAPAADVYPTRVAEARIADELARRPPGRPRLLIRDFEQLRAAARTAAGRALAGRIVHDAGQLLEKPPVVRRQIGKRLLSVSRCALFRIGTLATAFHLTGRTEFADRAIREMRAAAAFRDWNPSHFLDVGEMTLAMAIGYDWLHDRLSPEDRAAIRDAILRHGLQTSFADPDAGWIGAVNNWYAVCHGGLTAGAIAVYEDDPALAARVIARAVNGVGPSMKASYAPHGAYPEGPGYWSYGTDYTALLIATLECAFGHDFAISQAPGFAETGDYLAAATAPSGRMFNYADGGDGKVLGFAEFWLAHRFRRPELLTPWPLANLTGYGAGRPADSDRAGNRLLTLALAFLPADGAAAGEAPRSYFSGREARAPIAIFRSGPDAEAVYLALKAGAPNSPHGHMDAGSFVLEADGVRWAVDLGAEGYARLEALKIDLWNMRPGSERWEIFRLGHRSHNILLIDGRPQQAKGRAEIVEFTDRPDRRGAEIDLTPVYRGAAETVRRTARLLPDRSVEIRDRLTGLKPGAVVRWQMLTRAQAQPDGSGLLLTEKGRRLRIDAESPTAVRWRIAETGEFEQAFDTPNPNCRIVALETTAPADGAVEWRVTLRPQSAH